MTSRTDRDPHDDLGPDNAVNLDDLEVVEIADDYRSELVVSFSGKRLAALEEVADEWDIAPGEAARRLVDQALAVQSRPPGN